MRKTLRYRWLALMAIAILVGVAALGRQVGFSGSLLVKKRLLDPSRTSSLKAGMAFAMIGGPVDAPSFSSRDRKVIRRYFARPQRLPSGVLLRNLPPNLERYFQRDATLPSKLRERLEPFPQDLEERMSPLPEGYSRMILADRALILEGGATITDLVYIPHSQSERDSDVWSDE